jgi:hypothetical protein
MRVGVCVFVCVCACACVCVSVSSVCSFEHMAYSLPMRFLSAEVSRGSYNAGMEIDN